MALPSSSPSFSACRPRAYLACPSSSAFLKAPQFPLSYLSDCRAASIACALTKQQSMAVMAVEKEAELGEPLQRPDSFRRYGKFGGKYVSETLMYALTEREAAFKSLASDNEFQTLDFVISPDARLAPEDNDGLASLCEKVRYLQSVLDDFVRTHGDHSQMKSWEMRIKDAVHKAEDTIETYLHNIQCAGKSRKSRRKNCEIFRKNLRQVMEEIENIKTEEMQISDKADDPNIIRSGRYLLGNSLLNESVLGNTVVGLDNDVLDMKKRLTGFPLNLEIVPIVGMSGIGKSTLARRVYDDPFIVYHFDVRAWITISPEYEVKSVLLSLVRSVAQHTDDIYDKNDEAEQGHIILKDRIDQLSDQMLAEQLCKRLRGKMYLIVMDDIWLNSPWDDIKRSFPDDKNGSRLVLTSRHKDLAIHVKSSRSHEMRLLSVDQGWDLLKLKVFPRQSCPPELEDIGKKISEKCQGLPLAIVVVAGHLSNMSKERDVWLSVANDVSSLVTRKPAQFLDVIAMSYNHLPHHLKACFLYMGAFPENIHIPVWRLTALWIAEGFLKRDSSKGLEVLAEECLEELINRNLLIVEKTLHNRVITCRIHDLLRGLCLREAEKEKFWHVMRRNDLFPEGEESYHRRLCTHSDIFPYVTSKHSNPQIRTFLASATRLPFLSDSVFLQMGFKLLWLLDLFNYYFSNFPIPVLNLVHLRYLALTTSGDLPTAASSSTIGKWCLFPCVISSGSEHTVSISNLVNLQMLIINWGLGETHSLPLDIWKMTQLRHIRMGGGFVHFDDFFLAETNGRCSLVLPNLRTLLTVSSANFRKEIVAIFPSLKKLGIVVDDNQTDFLNYLSSLHFLETLKLSFSSQAGKSSISPWNAFPPNLRVLTLSGSHLLWEDMVTIGKIPNLEVLKLKQHAFIGQVWRTIEGGFLQLQYLKLENSELELWKATEFDFPNLQHLVLRFCYNLKEIPCDIGYVSMLRRLHVVSCGHSAAASAIRIKEHQQSLGNDDLEVRINME